MKRLDARIKTLDGNPDRFVTSEKKDLIVDTYVKWRISDFATYYLSTNGGNQAQAEALLTRRIGSGLRAEFGNRTIKEIVSGERDSLMREALIRGANSAQELGIEVIDVRVMQINLPVEATRSTVQKVVSRPSLFVLMWMRGLRSCYPMRNVNHGSYVVKGMLKQRVSMPVLITKIQSSSHSCVVCKLMSAALNQVTTFLYWIQAVSFSST